MNDPQDVLERNLALLFTRAWRPVLPRPAFRAKLARTFRERVGGRARRAHRPLERSWVAGAAALLLAALGWWLFRPAPMALPSDAAAILAAGEVAWRSGTGPWHGLAPLPDGQGSALAELGARRAPLELSTPPTASARLELATGALWLGPAGRLELASERELSLTRGSLEFSVVPGTAQSLRTAAGELELTAGRARLELSSDGLALELSNARARVSDVPAARVLEGDHRLRLRAGRIVEPQEPERSARSAAPPIPEPRGAEAGDGAHEPEAVLRGVVRRRDGFDEQGEPRWLAVEHYRVLLLREVQLPMAVMPEEIPERDDQGRFCVPPQESGSYSLCVQVEGQAVWRVSALALGPAPADPAQVPLLDVRVDAGLSVRGVVRDAQSGEPLAGAVVVSESDAPVSVLALDAETLDDRKLVRYTLSGPDGGFELEHVARGTQILRASGAGRAVAWAEPFELQGAVPYSGVEFELPAAGALTGRVLDAQGQPRTGATVLVSVTDFAAQRPCLSYKATLVDDQGHYSIDGLPGGMLAVLLFTDSRPGAGAPDLRFASLHPPATARLDFIAKLAGTRLTGVLRDSAGAPLPGSSLWIDGLESGDGVAGLVSTTTAADGAFEFEGLRPGEYELYLSGRVPTDLVRVGSVVLESESTTRIELEASSETIAGRVTALSGGAEVGAALIVLLRASDQRFMGKFMTDPQGRFRAEHVAPGIYDLRAVPMRGLLGDATLRGVSVAVGRGASALEIALPRGGALEVRVCDAAGKPLQDARVERLLADGDPCYQEEPALTDADGRRVLEGLGVGAWTLRVRLAGHAERELEVQVRAGEVGAVQVRLDPLR